MKSRYLYAGLILVIVLLLMMVGYLAGVLFSLEPATLDIAARERTGAPDAAQGPSARAEVLIETGDAPPPGYTDQAAEVTAAGVAPVGGIVPAMCLDYGPEISQRESHPGPVTHRAIAAAGEIVFYLNINETEANGN